MPRLMKLDLQGFKSFADPSTFLYPTGITAVVGPNGSGKSNVADAIRWVLGEQRLTAIRGRTGEDMIFAGSGKRPRGGMARAAITFDNSDGWLPVDFAEVTVERRTYRDGSSDYMINGSKVRLMDLRDMLDRAGLGRDAYLVIGQGLVDQVLSLRPQERLALFEQASGITPYRTRRGEAEARLDETRRNLQRVYDIVSEIEPRLRRLQRQTAKVEEHAQLQRELSTTLRIWYGYRWGRSVAGLDQARQRVVYREDRVTALLGRSETLGTKTAEQRGHIGDRREQLASLHRESSELHREAANRQRELAVARERQRQLRDRLEEAESLHAPLETALAAETEDLAELLVGLKEAETRHAALGELLREAEATHGDIVRQRHAALRRQAESQSRTLEVRHRLADGRARLEQARQRAEELSGQLRQLEADIGASAERRAGQMQVVEQDKRLYETAEANRERARVVVSEVESQLEARRAVVEQIRQGLVQEEAELQRVTARLEALERLHEEGAGLYAGVRAVLRAAEAGELGGLAGLVSTLIGVPAHLERAIEVALGSQVQNIVAASWGDAQAAIEWLKRKHAGRATFLPLDRLRPPSILELPDLPGVVGVASELVRYDPAYRPAALLLLGRTAVADELEAARRLHDVLRGGFTIVTLAGEVVRSSGSITGGEERNVQGPGLLARERERRELRDHVAALREAAKGTEARMAENAEAVEALVGRRQAALSERREQDQRAQQADQAVERAVRELERLNQTLQWQQQHLERAVVERDRVLGQVDTLAEACRVAEAELAELETEAGKAARELADLTDADAAAAVAARRTELAVVHQECESRRVLLDTREREAGRLRRQIQDQEDRIAALQAELVAVESGLEQLVADYEAARSHAEALGGRIAPLERELATLEDGMHALEREEQNARRLLREAEQQLSQAQVEANRREDQLQALRREIEESLNIVISNLPETISTQQPLPLDAIVTPLPVIAELPQGLEDQIRDLRTQIRRLEPVNLAAKEEYDELAERHQFLRTQVEDLEHASAHLREVIGELDQMMDTMFSSSFKAIAAEFSRVFEVLFNGGSAKLFLTDEEAPDGREGGQKGVEISARPPGKRASNLGMLSGGERSLTAVALIFAVMRISPTPFCVLDEVDAMLDEANVSRFRRLLQELSRETQFIIITHNRGTVDVADTIYGVSMGEDGVSKVLSLSLESLPSAEIGMGAGVM